MEHNYIKIGSSNPLGEGDYRFWEGQSENGACFKDEEAYLNDWDKPCYVAECDFEAAGPMGVCDYYTHKNLLALCHNNRKLCDAVFYTVDWQSPETYLDELGNSCDFKDFWPFVKAGAKVRWADPAGQTSGIFTVLEVRNVGADNWCADDIVLIGGGGSEAEVLLCELEEV